MIISWRRNLFLETLVCLCWAFSLTACGEDAPPAPAAPTTAAAPRTPQVAKAPIPEELRGEWWHADFVAADCPDEISKVLITANSISWTEADTKKPGCAGTGLFAPREPKMMDVSFKEKDGVYTGLSGTVFGHDCMVKGNITLAKQGEDLLFSTQCGFLDENFKLLKNPAGRPKGVAAKGTGGVIQKGDGASEETIDATVTVFPTKTNGKSWDAMKGSPDIALCYVAGGTKGCLPGGGTSVPGGSDPHCKDSLTCAFQVPANATQFEIIDVDMAGNDSIGAGPCKAGKTCRIGRSDLKLSGGAPKDACERLNNQCYSTGKLTNFLLGGTQPSYYGRWMPKEKRDMASAGALVVLCFQEMQAYLGGFTLNRERRVLMDHRPGFISLGSSTMTPRGDECSLKLGNVEVLSPFTERVWFYDGPGIYPEISEIRVTHSGKKRSSMAYHTDEIVKINILPDEIAFKPTTVKPAKGVVKVAYNKNGRSDVRYIKDVVKELKTRMTEVIPALESVDWHRIKDAKCCNFP